MYNNNPDRCGTNRLIPRLEIAPLSADDSHFEGIILCSKLKETRYNAAVDVTEPAALKDGRLWGRLVMYNAVLTEAAIARTRRKSRKCCRTNLTTAVSSFGSGRLGNIRLHSFELSINRRK